MIIEYQRPQNLKEALILLGREEPVSYPLGGGTVLNRGVLENIAVMPLSPHRGKGSCGMFLPEFMCGE